MRVYRVTYYTKGHILTHTCENTNDCIEFVASKEAQLSTRIVSVYMDVTEKFVNKI